MLRAWPLLTLLVVSATAHAQELPAAPSSDAVPADVLHARGMAAYEARDYAAASALLRRASDAGHWNGATWLALGDSDLRLHRPHDAIDALARAVALLPNGARANALYGVALALDGSWDLAARAYDAALAIDAHDEIAVGGARLLADGDAGASGLLLGLAPGAVRALVAQLQRLDDDSRTVSILYVTSGIVSALGLGIGGPLLGYAIDLPTHCVPGSRACELDGGTLFGGFGIAALVVGTIALAAFIAAIGMDVGLAERRTAWRARSIDGDTIVPAGDAHGETER